MLNREMASWKIKKYEIFVAEFYRLQKMSLLNKVTINCYDIE